MFQSPSNRVKCSDWMGQAVKFSQGKSFNPLVIGSSVLMVSIITEDPGDLTFQSPSNRVKCSDLLDGTEGMSPF